MKCYFLSLALLLSGTVLSQRTEVNLSQGWQFKKDNEALADDWKAIAIPHTWNKEDVMDDVPGYYRGAATYKRIIRVDRNRLLNQQYFLQFGAANQVAEVFVNGRKAGGHAGGYTAFYIPVTKYLKEGDNEILVQVDNSYNSDIPPLSADFTFYGGLYRSVRLIGTQPVHFSFQQQTNGIRIATPQVDSGKATLEVQMLLSNETNEARELLIEQRLTDAQGQLVKIYYTTCRIPAQTVDQQTEARFSITKPQLWSPDTPNRYTLATIIRDKHSRAVLDRVEQKTGFRWFRFDPAQGFILNGKPLKLVGTSRHQDFPGMGNAVPDALAVQDVVLLKKMGGNFLRIAHYPQAAAVMDACDSMGIVTSVEIPVVNEISETQAFFDQSMQMQREMVNQYFNHPSVVIWCYMNEVLLKTHYANDKERQKLYLQKVRSLAMALDSITRKEDPYRYTMIAHHGDYNKYKDAGLLDISMIIGWNLYSGWYGAKLTDFPAFLDMFHNKHPEKVMLVSEYGADADPRIISNDPVRFDKSVQYATQFHQYYIAEMLKRPFVAASMIWNLADFNSETRTESMPHINNKGLMEWDRTPKDPYFFYQALFSRNSFVKLLGLPFGKKATGEIPFFLLNTLQVAANTESVELFINGKSLGKKNPQMGLSSWDVTAYRGNCLVEVKGLSKGKLYRDKAYLYLVPGQDGYAELLRSGQLNLLLGAKRYFKDQDAHWWIPAGAYQPGNGGYIGGRVFQVPNGNRLPYGTDKNIIGTWNDPVYQTQQVGIEKFKLDLPAGAYELVLHFAELLGGAVRELPYNLNDPERIEPRGKRVFDVYVNNELFLDHVDLAAQYGVATAVAKKIRLQVKDGQGIEISFKPVEGEPVLNAVQVKKIESELP